MLSVGVLLDLQLSPRDGFSYRFHKLSGKVTRRLRALPSLLLGSALGMSEFLYEFRLVSHALN